MYHQILPFLCRIGNEPSSVSLVMLLYETGEHLLLGPTFLGWYISVIYHLPCMFHEVGSLCQENQLNLYDIANTITHWGRVTHICVDDITIIGSDNGLSPDRRQAIIWTNAGMLLIGPLGTIFGEIAIEILIFSFRKMHLKVSSAKWLPFCLSLNVIILCYVLMNWLWCWHM